MRREERRQLTPGAGAEEPMSNLGGRSFSLSQTSTTRFFSVRPSVLVATYDAEGLSIPPLLSVQITRTFHDVTHTPQLEPNRATRSLCRSSRSVFH